MSVRRECDFTGLRHRRGKKAGNHRADEDPPVLTAMLGSLPHPPQKNLEFERETPGASGIGLSSSRQVDQPLGRKLEMMSNTDEEAAGGVGGQDTHQLSGRQPSHSFTQQPPQDV